MKKVFVLGVICLLFAGCFGGFEDILEKHIDIRWLIVQEEQEISALTDPEGRGVIELKKGRYYGYIPIGGDHTKIEIIATLGGDSNKDFEFIPSGENKIEKVDKNMAILDPTVVEKGSILVKADEVETLVDYEILPTGSLGANPMYPWKINGFDFATGKEKNGIKDVDLYAQYGEFHGEVIILKRDTEADFLEQFLALNNLHELEYEQLSFAPDIGNIYIIKCKEGYAVADPTIGGYMGMGFIYKYSETGIFE